MLLSQDIRGGRLTLASSLGEMAFAVCVLVWACSTFFIYYILRQVKTIMTDAGQWP